MQSFPDSDTDPNAESDQARKVNFLSSLMIIIGVLMVLVNVYNATYQNAFSAAVYFVVVALLLIYYHYKQRYKLWSQLFLALNVITSLYLFVQKGTEGFGIYWPVIIPFLIFTVFEPVRSLRLTIAYLLVMIVIQLTKWQLITDDSLGITGFVVYLSILSTITGFLFMHNKNRKTAEDFANQEREKIKVLLNHTSVGMVMLSSDMQVKEVNTKMLEWFPDAIPANQPYCFECLNPGESKEKCEGCQVLEAIESGKPQERVKLKKTPKGERLFKIEVTPVKNQNNEVIGILQTFQDITEIKQLELVARQNEDRFKTLFQKMPNIAVQGYNREGRVLYWNKYSEKLYGYTEAEALGKIVNELIVPDEHKEYIMGTLQEWFDQAATEPVMELELKRKDGQMVHTLTSNILLPNSHGELELFSMDIDITARIIAETNLKQSDRIVYHAIDMLCIAGFDGYFKTLNPAWSKVLGYTTEELLSRPWNDFVHPDDVEATNNVKSTLVNGEETYQFVNRYVCKDGSIKWLSWNSFPDKENGIMYGIARDITEMKQMQDRLHESEQRLKGLVADLPGFVYRCANDENWTMEFISEGCKLITGYKASDFISNKKLSYNDLICPDYQEYARAKWDKAISEKHFCELEYKICHADGNPRWFWERGHAVFDEKERIKYLEGFIMDITSRKTAEQLLKESEQKFRQLTDVSSACIYMISNGRFTMINPAVTKLTGYTLDELASKEILDIIHPEDKAMVATRMKNRLEGKEEVKNYELRILDRTGNTLWINNAVELIKREGNPYFIGTFFDITERKQAELALRESQQKLKAVFDGANIGISMINPDGKYVMANDWWLNYLGYSHEEMYQLTNLDITHPDDQEESSKMIKLMLNSEISQYRLEKRYVRKDGKVVWGDLSVSAIYNEANKPYLFAGMVMDITKQKSDQEALQRSEKRYRLITENSTDVIWVLDVESRKFTYISPSIQQLRGYTVAEALNQTMNESIASDSIPVVEEQLGNGIMNFLKDESIPQKPTLTEIQQPCKNGSMIWVEVSTTIRRSQEGRLEVVGISRNIEERKQMEDELWAAKANLELSNATKDKFFSIIAHDLRSPFSGLLGLSELLSDDLEMLTEEEIRRSAKMINQAADSAYNLLENLLEWSRTQRGTMAFNPMPLALYREVNAQIDIAETTARQKHILLKNNTEPLTMINADKQMLQTILRNLISNGIKFSNLGGLITIYSRQMDHEVVLVVEDQGIGMDNVTIDNLFKLEFKGEKGTRNEPGSGLGLILVKEFMDKHGGTIKVESLPGKGSRFSLSFPS